MSTSINSYDKNLWTRLIQSNDPKDKEQLNSIVMKIIEEKKEYQFGFLLDIGYKVDVLNEKGQTALHYAFSIHNNLIVEKILNWEPFKNDSFNYMDSNGLTHLHIACVPYHVDVLETMKRYLKNGSDVNACYHTDPENMNSQFTPLHFAMKHFKFEIVQFLLENGANVRAVDSKGRTPLHLASQLYLMKNALHTIELLITSYHSDIEAKDERGDTPLLTIFDDYCNMELNFRIREADLKFDLLLKNGANITTRNNKGDTVLHLVIKTLRLTHCHFYRPYVSFDDTKHVELVKKILKNNSEFLEVKNGKGETPLQLAVSMASADVVKVLLDNGADISFTKIDCGIQEIFIYLDVMPNFDIMHNILGIINSIVDKGFELSVEDHLVVLRLLVHEVKNCNCLTHEYGKNDEKTFNLLEFGCAAHVKQILSSLREKNKITYRIEDHAEEYLHMMGEGNFYLDKEIRKMLKELTHRNLIYSYDTSKIIKKELAHLKSDIKLKNGIMLYDLMSKHPHLASRVLTVDNFDHKLLNGFVLYRDIIEGYITQAIVRNYLVKSAHILLKLTPLPLLPNLCTELIMSYLSNVDIFNLCSTALLCQNEKIQ